MGYIWVFFEAFP